MSISTQIILFFLTSSFPLSNGQSVDEQALQAVDLGPSYLEPDTFNVQDTNVALLKPNDQISDDELYAAEPNESGDIYGLDRWYEPSGLNEPETLNESKEPDEAAESNGLCDGQAGATIRAREVEEQRACRNPTANSNMPRIKPRPRKKPKPDFQYYGNQGILEFYRDQPVYPHPTVSKLRIYCEPPYAIYCCSAAWNAEDDNNLSGRCKTWKIPCKKPYIEWCCRVIASPRQYFCNMPNVVPPDPKSPETTEDRSNYQN